ncbi:hypothetical protein V4890_23880 [Ralstonia solanacearum species complex bacterium KE056]
MFRDHLELELDRCDGERIDARGHHRVALDDGDADLIAEMQKQKLSA